MIDIPLAKFTGKPGNGSLKLDGARLQNQWIWCNDNRHRPMIELYEILCSKLRGFYQYFTA
ncbi:hypothetical protein [Desulfosarcina sp. BuS5]|uniref:hypothetical protein n=1 Tax=Desulfosarcina sp. BuS5 TaxID=933262 RepID=UPI0023788F2A|nr:hypothetical protein [Desulfosarcina sp. BuS5]